MLHRFHSVKRTSPYWLSMVQTIPLCPKDPFALSITAILSAISWHLVLLWMNLDVSTWTEFPDLWGLADYIGLRSKVKGVLTYALASRWTKHSSLQHSRLAPDAVQTEAQSVTYYREAPDTVVFNIAGVEAAMLLSNCLNAAFMIETFYKPKPHRDI